MFFLRYLWLLFSIVIAVLISTGGVFASPTGYYQLSTPTFSTDGTRADRLLTESTDYKFDYGEKASVTYSLPWPFVFYGQSYTQITADANGNIWLGNVNSSLPKSFPLASTGPVISAWNNDLSSYYHGGVFVQHKANPERVVVQWRTETGEAAGYGRLNDFETILFEDGKIRINYNLFSASASGDSGSGFSQGDGLNFFNLTAISGNVFNLAGKSFLFEKPSLPPEFTVNPIPSMVNSGTLTLTGTMDEGAFITVEVDTAALVGSVEYPSPTTWNCSISGLPEGRASITVSARNSFNVSASREPFPVVIDTVPPTLNVGPVASPTKSAMTTLAGTMEPGATVSISADTAAVIGAITYPSAASWSCNVTGLQEGLNRFTVVAIDSATNKAIIPIDIEFDTVAPVVVINSPTAGFGNNLAPVLQYSVSDGNTVVKLGEKVISISSGQVLDLPGDGEYRLVVEATDAATNKGTAEVVFIVDTVPPTVSISAVTSPTRQSTQTVSGTREANAALTVLVPEGVSVGTISYPTATTWKCILSDFSEGDNAFTIVASDAAGNTAQSSGLISFVPPLSIAAAPTVISADYKGLVRLDVRHILQGDSVFVEQGVDINDNGFVDANEPIVRSFSLTDGTGSGNPNVQADEDGSTQGSISTSIGYYNILDLYHAPAKYVFRITHGQETAMASMEVTAVSNPQIISGTVTDGINPLPGAIVNLVDKWQRLAGFAITDSTGQFLFNVMKPGEYFPEARAGGFATDLSVHPKVILPAGGVVMGVALKVSQGQYPLTGFVFDGKTGVGIDGVKVNAFGAGFAAAALTDAQGIYKMNLPPGEYNIRVEAADANSPAHKGYVPSNSLPYKIIIPSELFGVDFALAPATDLLSGTVSDDYGIPVAGLTVQAISEGASQGNYLAEAVTNGAGKYTAGLLGGHWTVSLENDSMQTLGYMGDHLNGVAIPTSQTQANNLSAFAITAWIEGIVSDAANGPIGGIKVTLRNAMGDFLADTLTAADGTYRFGVPAGNWYLNALVANKGYLPASEKMVSLAQGQNLRCDFITEVNNHPDLVVSELSTVSNAQSGHSIKVDAVLRNQGKRATDERIFVKFCLSTDSIFDATDRVLDTVEAAIGFGALGEMEISRALMIPNGTQTGNYHLFAIVDPDDRVKDENNQGNNSMATPLMVTYIPPDLAVNSVTPEEPNLLAGQFVNISLVVGNLGGESAEEKFEITLYLSTDTVFDAGDSTLGKYGMAHGMAPNEFSEISKRVKIPKQTASGTYYILGVIDPKEGVTDDANRANNVNFSPPVTVQK